MRLAIRHTTTYRFEEPVAHGVQRLRLTPKETQGQTILDWSMEFEDAVEQLSYDDQNFNHCTLIAVNPGARQVRVTCSGTVETQDKAGVIGRHAGHLPIWSFLGQTDLTKPGPRIRQLISAHAKQKGDTLACLHALSADIRKNVSYAKGATGVDTTAEEAAAAGEGVCQDHSHIFISAARALDIPARYVSGYLMMNDRIEQEATHAWAEAYVDQLGWVGFDISNQISPDPRYVRVATGRDYRDAAPVAGISFGAITQDLTVDLLVEQQRSAVQEPQTEQPQ